MTRIGKRAFGLGFACLLGMACTGAARAQQPVISDPLNAWPLNLGQQTDVIKLENGVVHITAPANRASWALYSGFSFGDMDASITITPVNNVGGVAGLVFWATDSSDFDTLLVNLTAGSFGVFGHKSDGSWTTVVPYTNTTAVKAGAPASLRIMTKGNRALLYINGVSIGSLGLLAPKAGGAIGIVGQGGPKDASDFAFSNLTVGN